MRKITRKLLATINFYEQKIGVEKGPRGERIIGYTKNHKPIYESHDHPEHEKFNVHDVRDAAYLHARRKEKYEDMLKKHPASSLGFDRIKNRVKYHNNQFGEFYNKARIMDQADKKKKKLENS